MVLVKDLPETSSTSTTKASYDESADGQASDHVDSSAIISDDDDEAPIAEADGYSADAVHSVDDTPVSHKHDNSQRLIHGSLLSHRNSHHKITQHRPGSKDSTRAQHDHQVIHPNRRGQRDGESRVLSSQYDDEDETSDWLDKDDERRDDDDDDDGLFHLKPIAFH